MKLGVFDSGIGGRAIADSLQRDFPSASIMYVHDKAHMPYGGRTKADIISLTEAAIQPLLQAACDIIVIACNTATAAAIEYLRKTYANQLFIGLEPMVKPASLQTNSGVIAVCATPFTFQSERYNALKETYAKNITIIEPDCQNWAAMIEHDAVDDTAITQTIHAALEKNADVIVLACTHYHWIKQRIIEAADGRAVVIDPSEAISRQVISLLGPSFEA